MECNRTVPNLIYTDVIPYSDLAPVFWFMQLTVALAQKLTDIDHEV